MKGGHIIGCGASGIHSGAWLTDMGKIHLDLKVFKYMF